eukprot:GILJ01004974.1.p1 GENE.GILJ01004974.1~~GILJ01004974.1.p1  ORF type:complete len:391 (+),score=38.53 GILJ01004974.1:123-1295(+)
MKHTVVCCVLAVLLNVCAATKLTKDFTAQESNFIPGPDDTIDIVYTWVNGSDPAWLEQHESYLRTEATAAHVSIEEIRKRFDEVSKLFFNNDELKFSLRSVDKYLDRKSVKLGTIYIVTNNQIPSWLDTSSGEVKVVYHDKIFKDPKNAPSFSTWAIESNLHHIPGLSDHYIVFNDDYMLGRRVTRGSFITPQGQVKMRFADYLVTPAYETLWRPWARALWYADKMLTSKYRRRRRFAQAHAPQLFNKRIAQELERTFQRDFDMTAANRFRGKGKNLVINFLYMYYVLNGRKFPAVELSRFAQTEFVSVDLTKYGTSPEQLTVLRNAGRQLFFNPNKNSGPNEVMQQFLREKFPSPCRWEKQEKEAAGPSHPHPHIDGGHVGHRIGNGNG